MSKGIGMVTKLKEGMKIRSTAEGFMERTMMLTLTGRIKN